MTAPKRVVAGETLECAREVEVLEGPPGFRMRTEHRSPRVPGFVVESDEIRVDGGGAIRTLTECVEFTRGE